MTNEPTSRLASVALRVHDMEAMTAFYTEAFGARFEDVDAGGLRCRFGEVAGILLKLVPLRSAAELDFAGHPVHQPGFEVEDLERVVAVAERHGGRQDGDVVRRGGRLRGAVRDPDGNTVELSSPA